MASSLDIVVATERLLTHHDREERNRLDGAILANASSLTLEFDPNGISKGAWLGIDWELFDVWSDPVGKAVTVEGGAQGTTPANHADNAHVIVKPKFPRDFILDDINHELADLSSPMNGLFKVTTLDITYDSSVRGYNAAGLLSENAVIDISWEPNTSTKARRYLKPGDYSAGTGLDTGDFASGSAIFLPSGISDGYVVRARYASTFTSIATDTADVATTSGLPATALDLLHLGAAIRRLDSLEPSRVYTDAQGSTRRSDEVPPGAQDRATRGYREMRAKRISAEAARLRALFPMVLR